MENGIINDIEYIKFGTGSKVFVMLPGLAVKSVMGVKEAIADAYKDFDETHTTYLFDRRTPAPEGYTIQQMAEDTAEVMKELGLKDVDLFGASQGGMMAQVIAGEYPELVHKLVLGSSAFCTTDTALKTIGEWVELAKQKNPIALAKSIVKNLYSEDTIEALGSALIEDNADATEEQLKQFATVGDSILHFDNSEFLKKVTCDTLVLGSTNDKVLGPESSLQIAQRLGCFYYIYDGYSHAVFDEAPDFKARLLEFFLN